MKAAVIGLGRMGRRHVQALQNLGMEVAGIYDQSHDTLQTALRELRLPQSAVHASAESLLNAGAPEALVVATTAPSHASLVCAAAQAGVRYVLCEKPLATSLREADLMLETCARHGTVLAVNHQMRFMPQYIAARDALASEDLGGLVRILVAGSNFGLAMNGSHYFEVFRFITGQRVQTVQAWFDDEMVPNPRGPEFVDRAGSVRVTGANGISMYMELPARAGHGVQLVFIGRYGHLQIDELTSTARIFRRQAEYRNLPTTRYGSPAIDETKQIAGGDIIAATSAVWSHVLGGRDFPDGAAGRHTVNCLCAAHTSNELGNIPIRIDDSRIDLDKRYPWA